MAVLAGGASAYISDSLYTSTAAPGLDFRVTRSPSDIRSCPFRFTETLASMSVTVYFIRGRNP